MPELADVFEIDDAETFELLTDPTRAELLEWLFEPASVSELAEAMDVPRTRLYHHVRLLEETGVIRVVQTRQRGAIPEKIYQLTAKEYLPSKKLLAEYPRRHAAAAMVDPILSTTRADIIRAVADGRFDFREREDHLKNGMLGRYLVVLSPQRRHQLLTELKAVLDRYQDDDPDGELVATVFLIYTSSRGAAAGRKHQAG